MISGKNHLTNGRIEKVEGVWYAYTDRDTLIGENKDRSYLETIVFNHYKILYGNEIEFKSKGNEWAANFTVHAIIFNQKAGEKWTRN